MKTRGSFRGLRGKLLVIFISIALIPLILMSWLSYFAARDALQGQVLNQLISIREAKKSELETYFAIIRKQAVTMSENTMMVEAMEEFANAFNSVEASELPEGYEQSLRSYYEREYLLQLTENLGSEVEVEKYWPPNPVTRLLQYHYISNNRNPLGHKDNLNIAQDGSIYSEVHGKYHPIIRNFLEEFGYYDIFLVDNDGNIVYSVFKEVDFATNLANGVYRNTSFADAFRTSAQAENATFVQLVDFKPYAPSYSAPASFISSPIYRGKEKIGILVFQVPVDMINAMMTNDQDWQGMGLGATGEVYLVGNDYRMRSDARFLAEDQNEQIRRLGTTILLKEIKTEGTEAALQGGMGIRTFRNYRGVDVLGAYSPLNIDDVQWVLLAEKDMDEAFAAVNRLGRNMLRLTSIVAVAVMILGIWLSSSISGPLVALSNAANRVAEGDLNVEIPFAGRKDEIGDFGQIFAYMVSKLSHKAQVADQIAAGQLDIEFIPKSENDVLANALARMIAKLKEEREQLRENVHSLAADTSQMSNITSKFVTNVDDMNHVTHETNGTLDGVKKSVEQMQQQAKQIVHYSARISHTSRYTVENTLQSMRHIREQMKVLTQDVVNLNEREQTMSQIVATTMDLANQSNQLALDAVIQATKHERNDSGFATVAQEIRELARQLNNMSVQVQTFWDDIRQLMSIAVVDAEQSAKEVEGGSSQFSQATEAIQFLLDDVSQIEQLANQMTDTIQYQLQGTEHSTSGIDQIKQVNVQNLQGAEQLESVTQRVDEAGKRLKQLVGTFLL